MLLSTIGVDVKLFETSLLVFVLSYIVTRTGDTVPENVVGYNKSVLLRTKLESESKNVTLNTSYSNETSCFDAHKVQLYLLLEETYISASTKYNRTLQTWKQMILFLSERMRYREKYAVLVNGHKPNLKAENRPCCFSLFSENRKSEFPDHKTDDVTISWKDVSLRLLQAIVTIFVLYETERKYRENEHDVLNKNNEESNSYKTEKHFLFRFTNSYFRQQYTVYPLSLQKYFKDANNTQGKNKAMNYEWARYGTFLTFPDKSPVTPMRLARAGFYYIGEGEEAICYSCGLRNHHWSSKETVFDTHKRLSPNCPFIKGTDKTNVPIHDNISNVEITSENSGASGGPEDAVTEICNSERLTDHSDKPTGQNNDVNNDENTTQIHRNTSQHESTNIGNVENISRYQREEPKNPNFTIKSQRMATFSCWPATHPIQPAELAEAGFFFVGPNDLVRCFYCGGGMQSWQPGDNPWVEHARWFPTCAYVRQFKGDNFVNMCRDAHLDPDMYNQLSEPGYDETMSVSSDVQLEDINSTVVSNVLDMGYSQQQVREAIREHRRTLGSTEQQTHHLLEYLRDHPPTQPGHVVEKTNVPSKPRENLENKQSSSEDTDQKNLAAENEQLKEKMACKICYDNDANIVFLPCGHMVSCVECAHALRKCAVCRKLINSRIRTYLS